MKAKAMGAKWRIDTSKPSTKTKANIRESYKHLPRAMSKVGGGKAPTTMPRRIPSRKEVVLAGE